MGFFDFLKDVGFTAPESEPQRGTLIQTDNIGTGSRPVNRIVTTPTDDGRSRIMSRDEYSRRNTDQGRGRDDVAYYERGLPRVGVDPRQMDTQGFSTANVPSNALQILRDREDAQGGIATMPRNIYRDMDAQRQRVSGLPAANQANPSISPPLKKPPLPYHLLGDAPHPGKLLSAPPLKPDLSQPQGSGSLPTDDELRRAYEMKYGSLQDLPTIEELRRAYLSGELASPSPRRFMPKSGLHSDQNLPQGDFSFSSEVNQDENLDNWVEPNSLSVIKERQEKEKTWKDYLSNLWKSRYTTESAGFDEIGGDKNFPPSSVTRTTGYMHQQPEFPQSGNFGARANVPDAMFVGGISPQEDQLGGNMVGIGKNVPSYTTQAYTGSQPKQGVSSFADAKKEIIEGKEGGIKDLNLLQKGMALLRNPIGRAMNYETDDQGRLTMKGIADMEADKQKSEAFYQEGQRQRNLDRDRAMGSQQTPFDPCPTGFTYDPSTQSCVADATEEEATSGLYGGRNPMSQQEYMNQFRKPGETGDVPLSQYGRRGGEYVWWMADGGSPKQNTGVVTGAGGPKDDLVGPVMLSNTEYVLPTEQVSMYGGGNYQTGLKRLENDRIQALNNFA